MPVDFGLLNQQMQSLMQGLQAQPWTFNPAELTGDATTNRARVYSGTATDPRSAGLTPGSYAPGTPGPTMAGGAQSPFAQPAASTPFAAPASAVAEVAPTQTAAPAEMPSQAMSAPAGGATSYAGTGGSPLTGFDLSSIQQMFTPGQSPKEWGQVAIDPEWQKQYQAGHYANVESALRDGGMKPTDGLYMTSADAPPPVSSKDGYWAMSGPAGTVDGGGDNGPGRQQFQYQYIARPQAPQIPPDLQAQVMQFLSGKPNG